MPLMLIMAVVLGLVVTVALQEAHAQSQIDVTPTGNLGDEDSGLLSSTTDADALTADSKTYAVMASISDNGLPPAGLSTTIDYTKPEFTSATLDENTGAMTITFSEAIDVSATRLSKLYVSNENRVNTVPLGGAELDFGSADVETLSLTLAKHQLRRVIPMDVPQLDIGAGAVSNTLGNQIEASPDNPITLTSNVIG